MMEEVSHPEEGAAVSPVVGETSPPPPTQNPQTQIFTPPPPVSYPTSTSGLSPAATYGATQSPNGSFSSPVASYSSSTLTTTPPRPVPASQPPPPASSTVVLSDMPEYSTEQTQQAGSTAGGMWGWIKSASQNTFVQSVVEKTKTGMDRMITTLDPGMTPYLRQGGDMVVVVASEKEVKWGAVRDAFQKVFGLAQVSGMPAQSGVAPQPVGYAAGLRGAQDRISYLRRSGLVDEKQLCIAVESFVAELLPDKWFDIGCVVLDDPAHSIKLEMFTQAVPVPAEIIQHVQSATPSNYDLSWSGLSVTIGQAFQHHMPWIQPSDWHKTLTGQSRQAIIYSAALTLAGLYKEKFPKSAPGRPI